MWESTSILERRMRRVAARDSDGGMNSQTATQMTGTIVMTAALGMKVRTVMIQSQKVQRRTYFLEHEREQEMKRRKRKEAPKDPGSNIIDHHERLFNLRDIPCTQPAVYLLSSKLDPDPEVYADRENECIHHHQPTTSPLLAPTG